ncbi:MAG: hypothetical protein AB8F94_08800 [Saprospiraceae bacterium]
MADKKPFYILGVAAAVLLMFFIFLGDDSERFDWAEHYEAESKDPFGTLVIHEILDDYFPNNDFTEIKEGLNEELPSLADKNSNYIFIGESMFLDSADVNALLNYVREGNTAFISSKTIPIDLMVELYNQECNNEPWNDYATMADTLAIFNFLHPQLKDEGNPYLFTSGGELISYGWNYIDSAYFCEEPHSMIQLGTINEQVNFAKKEYGFNGGVFYLHTTPMNFTNMAMLEKPDLVYANKVFSHLNEGDIYWDEYSRVGEGFGRAYNQKRGGGANRTIASEESLKYILAQPSLAWAWYLMIGMGFLYLFFRAKRKQRIIPVLERNENTSFEFISTIGRLYFLQNDHKKLCQQKMKLFYSYIRDRYNLNTTKVDDEFMTKLIAKSEVPSPVLKKIFDFYKNIKSSPFVSEQTLIDFHLRMDEFYKKCK